MDAPTADHAPVRKTSGWWKPLALIAIVCAIVILSHILGIGAKFVALRDWIATLGPWAPVIYVFAYIAATVAALPGSALTVIAGAVFGSVTGIVLVSIASTTGASLAFLIARYFARNAVVSWLHTNKKFQRLDELSEVHGAVIVALTRLVPLFPFNILNYGFGLTKVKFLTYVFWSWLCMLPGTVLFVVGADAFVKGIAEGKVPWGLIAVLVAATVVVFLLVRSARKRLEQPVAGAESPDKPEKV